MQMGEPAPCFTRSVSQPLFASCGFKEGDRLHALTTSISFGRFMTEPLDWEKWSSFSHNRTLEDVQKYSRPGAVAEKKAFFEAYYKNFATKKENKSPNRGVEPVISSNEDVCVPSTTNLAFSETGSVEEERTSTENVSSPCTNLVWSSNSGVKPETASNKDVCLPSTNLVCSEIRNVDCCIASSTSQVEPCADLVFSQFMDVKDDSSNNRGLESEISSSEDVGLPCTNLVFSGNQNVDDMITSSGQMKQEKASDNIGVGPETSLKEDVGLPRTNLVFTENRNVDDLIARSGQIEQENASTKKVSSKKHRFQVEILNHVEKNKKRQIKDKISVQTKTEISRVKSSSRKAPIAEIQHKKTARDSFEKKKSVLQSLHLSIRFPASLNKNLNLKTSNKPKDRSIQHALTTVSSVNGVKQNSEIISRTEDKRSKSLLNCSLNGSKATVLKSLSTNHSEALIASTKKPRSTTVFSSFSFRSDERASKRKEFFQKLEEKGKTSKTEKTQLQPKLKEKGRSNNRKLPWRTGLEAKPSFSETKVPNNVIQKVPPKLGKKNFIELNKKNLSSSMACLPGKKLHDSALMLKK